MTDSQPLLSQAQDVEHGVRQRAQTTFQKIVDDTKSKSFIPQVLGEFVGQILFNYMLQTILITVGKSGASPLAGLLTSSIYIAIFFTLLYLILAPITGMFVNPSIALNFIFIGKLPVVRGLGIVVAQLLGSIVGAGLVKASYPGGTPAELGVSDIPSGQTVVNALIGEIVGTFIFNLAIVAHLDAEYGVNPKVGSFTIGGTLGFLVFIIAPISGASLNPARSFGPAIIFAYFNNLWIYILGPVIGGVAAGQVYARVIRH